MNRYTLEGLLADAAHGKRVVYVGNRARLWFGDAEYVAEQEHPGEVAYVCRANGRERIEFVGGGVLSFHRTGHGGLRGLSADVVVLDATASRDADVVRDAELVVETAVGGEVIRA